MEVKKDFGKRMAALAEGIPREVMASLLTRLMPTVAVATREPEPRGALQPATSSPTRDPFASKGSTARKRRPRGARSRTYRVTYGGALCNHRKGTWTYAMVASALVCTNTLEAEERCRDVYPQFDYKTIDWPWLEAKGYITFDV